MTEYDSGRETTFCNAKSHNAHLTLTESAKTLRLVIIVCTTDCSNLTTGNHLQFPKGFACRIMKPSLTISLTGKLSLIRMKPSLIICNREGLGNLNKPGF
jgi:hypothetical protein